MRIVKGKLLYYLVFCILFIFALGIGLSLFIQGRDGTSSSIEWILKTGRYSTKLDEIKNRWGNVLFDAEQFRESSLRSAMIADLIERKILIGLSKSEVKILLGEPDGDYFFNDDFLTYKVLETKDDDNNTKIWNLVLIQDRNFKIKNVVLWKKTRN